MSRAILCILAVALLAVGLAMAWRTAGREGGPRYAAGDPRMEWRTYTQVLYLNVQIRQIRAMGWAVLGLLAAIAVLSLGRQLVATRRVVVFHGGDGQSGL